MNRHEDPTTTIRRLQAEIQRLERQVDDLEQEQEQPETVQSDGDWLDHSPPNRSEHGWMI